MNAAPTSDPCRHPAVAAKISLAKQLSGALRADAAQRAITEQRLCELADRWEPDTVTLLANCTDIVARADKFRDSAYITAVSDRYDAKTRRVMLQIMHHAVYGSSWEGAGAAVDHARETDVRQLFDVLCQDAVSAAAFGVAMTWVGAATVAGTTATGTAMLKAYKAGTVAGKAKAMLWGGATLGIGGLAAGAGLVAFSIYMVARESNAPERRACFTTELGKDLLFVEILTGHRYGGGRTAEPSHRSGAASAPDMRHAYMGGHAQ